MLTGRAGSGLILLLRMAREPDSSLSRGPLESIRPAEAGRL